MPRGRSGFECAFVLIVVHVAYQHGVYGVCISFILGFDCVECESMQEAEQGSGGC